MLDAALKSQLAGYFERLKHPIELVASLDDRAASAELRALLEDIVALSNLISVRFDGQDSRRPSFSIGRVGAVAGVRFAAIPMGHEFTSLVLALLQAGGHPPKADAGLIEKIVALDADLHFETYMSLSCHNCPDVVQALNLMAVLNPRIHHVAIDGGHFKDEVEARQIMAVPSVYLNGELFGAGRMTLQEIVAKVDTQGSVRDAATLAAKAPYDVLIIGGGPAGAAAAMYAARKGIRTGIVAERFGGQTLDTMGIENYPSVSHTTGPQFAAALQAQVLAHEVDLIEGHRVSALTAAAQPGGLVGIALDNGAQLRSRTVILATGARWRNVDVPGEQAYRNKGVAYCPHCDGPLFKDKPVAVIGGGNSGVEAAIDLAGVVAHVTLLEFAEQLKADAVLVNKLKSLANVTVHTSAQTTEITGDGQKVDGLVYRSRIDGQSHRVALAGVFVQIGLVPATEWLKGTVALSKYREIVVDAHGATNLAGVFAAGDVTTTPFKQIGIAAGEGAKAALSAFDYLIRTPAAASAGAATAVAQAPSLALAA